MTSFHAHDTDLVIEQHGTLPQRWFMIAGKDCEISLEPRPSYCDRGEWIAKLFPTGRLALEIDDADRWPRYYFDLDRALLEIQAWLKKREQMP